MVLAMERKFRSMELRPEWQSALFMYETLLASTYLAYVCCHYRSLGRNGCDLPSRRKRACHLQRRGSVSGLVGLIHTLGVPPERSCRGIPLRRRYKSVLDHAVILLYGAISGLKHARYAY